MLAKDYMMCSFVIFCKCMCKILHKQIVFFVFSKKLKLFVQKAVKAGEPNDGVYLIYI